MQTQIEAAVEVKIKCTECGKCFLHEELGGCFTCDARFCSKCEQRCHCEKISDLVQALTGIANRTGKHAELAGHLYVTSTGLRKLEQEAAA
jgi:hypothetical protein